MFGRNNQLIAAFHSKIQFSPFFTKNIKKQILKNESNSNLPFAKRSFRKLRIKNNEDFKDEHDLFSDFSHRLAFKNLTQLAKNALGFTNDIVSDNIISHGFNIPYQLFK